MKNFVIFQHIPIVYDKSGWAYSLSLVYDQQERSYRGACLACMEIRWRNEETINCTRDGIYSLKIFTSTLSTSIVLQDNNFLFVSELI